jgi:hypothetical protein
MNLDAVIATVYLVATGYVLTKRGARALSVAWLIFGALAASALLCSPAHAQPRCDPEARGIDALSRRAWPEAATAFREALRACGETAARHHGLAFAAYSAGDALGALGAARRCAAMGDRGGECARIAERVAGVVPAPAPAATPAQSPLPAPSIVVRDRVVIPRERSLVGPVAVTAVGAALVVLGGVFVALRDASLAPCEVVEERVAVCPDAESERDARRSPTWAGAATAAFAVGGVMLLAGVVWWVVPELRGQPAGGVRF